MMDSPCSAPSAQGRPLVQTLSLMRLPKESEKRPDNGCDGGGFDVLVSLVTVVEERSRVRCRQA